MKRAVAIAGWIALGFLAGALILVGWIGSADGPPYNICGTSMEGQPFAMVGLVMIAAGFLIGLVASIGPWGVEFLPRLPGIIAAGVALPVFFIYVFNLMMAFGWEC